MTKIGVREFSTPAVLLSSPVSASQNKIAGITLPSKPLIKISPICLSVYFLICLMAKGSRTSPEEIILIEATCKELRPMRPSFIKIKLLPQIRDRRMKMLQSSNLLFVNTKVMLIKRQKCAKLLHIPKFHSMFVSIDNLS